MNKVNVCLLLFPGGGQEGDLIVLDRYFDSSNIIEFKTQAGVKNLKRVSSAVTSFH